jgi:hypothetical protein
MLIITTTSTILCILMAQKRKEIQRDNCKNTYLIIFLNSDKSLMNTKHHQYISEDEFEFPKLMPNRASTAPPRPLTEIEEFR